MRTKTLVLTALLGIAASPLFAQTNVYSVNAVGYVQKVFPAAQYVLFANPLTTTNNTLAGLFPTAPRFSQVFKWNGATFDSASKSSTAWNPPDMTFNPGEGGFFFAAQDYTNTFVGEVMQGNLTNGFPIGYSVRGSMVPQTGTADDLNLSPSLARFDQLFKWNGSSYDSYSKTSTGWSGGNVPVINVAEAVFLNTANGGNWTRTFSVNN